MRTKIFEYTDGSTITMSEIEEMNSRDIQLSDEDMEEIDHLEIGETYTFGDMMNRLTRIL
jgi:diketogulonate reductase-like aldo/keto reductase